MEPSHLILGKAHFNFNPCVRYNQRTHPSGLHVGAEVRRSWLVPSHSGSHRMPFYLSEIDSRWMDCVASHRKLACGLVCVCVCVLEWYLFGAACSTRASHSERDPASVAVNAVWFLEHLSSHPFHASAAR